MIPAGDARRGSLRTKISLAFLAVALLVAAFIVVVLWVQMKAAERAAILEAESMAAVVANRIGDTGMADLPSVRRQIADYFKRDARDIFVVDANKQVVADADPKEVGMSYMRDPDNAIGRTLSDGQTRTYLEASEPDGASTRQVVVPIRGDANGRAKTIVGAVILEYTPLYNALMAQVRNAFYVVAALAVVFVLLTAAFGIRVAFNVSGPLVQLRQGVDALAAGNYDVRVREDSNDEVGALASAFNRMASDLQTATHKLQESQRELEQRVASRTVDLQDAEEAQRQSAAELRSLTEHVPVALAYVDRELRYRYHNKRYAVVACRTSAEIDGRTVTDVWGPAAYQSMEVHIARVLDGHEVAAENAGVAADGTGQAFYTTWVPRLDKDGVAAGFYVMVQNVTERRVAEEALRKSNDELVRMNLRLQEAQSQLLQADKMASIGQLASGVAHEINNPIGYVYSNFGTLDGYLGNIFALLEQYRAAMEAIDEPGIQTEFRAAWRDADLDFVRGDVVALMAESMEGIKRVKQIVHDLKNFSRAAGDESWQWADLHLGIDSTINIVWNELKYKTEVCKHYGELPLVQCRPSQLNQVFLNMLVNGADAIKRHGTISISSGVDQDHVWVEFADTGEGISAEHVNRIFDPFFTTKPVGKGTGLGLSVAYGIVAAHNGRIDVRTEVGKGTAFRIRLPIRQEPADQTTS